MYAQLKKLNGSPGRYFYQVMPICRSENEGSVPEMVIVELQGDLETKSQSASLSGKFVGDLHFTKSVKVVLQCIMYKRKFVRILH